MAGIVEEGLQPGSLGLGVPGLDNVTVVKEREEEEAEEETKRDGEEDWGCKTLWHRPC